MRQDLGDDRVWLFAEWIGGEFAPKSGIALHQTDYVSFIVGCPKIYVLPNWTAH